MRVQLLQPVELCDPLLKSQASKIRHANGFVQPVVRFVAREEEITFALLSVDIVPKAPQFVVDGFRCDGHYSFKLR